MNINPAPKDMSYIYSENKFKSFFNEFTFFKIDSNKLLFIISKSIGVSYLYLIFSFISFGLKFSSINKYSDKFSILTFLGSLNCFLNSDIHFEGTK